MSISDRDFEALSAYLDGELSGKALAHLEAQLQTNHDLKVAYDQLQRTRSAIRKLPKIRAPRNYLLTPEMVGIHRKPPRAFPVLRLASVLATLLLILVFMGDVFVLPTVPLVRSDALQFAAPAAEEPVEPILEAEIVESQLPTALVEEEMERLMVEGESPPPAMPEAMEMPAEEAAPAEDMQITSALSTPVEEAADDLGGQEEPEEEPLLKIETRAPDLQFAAEAGPRYDYEAIVTFTEISLFIIALMTGLTAFYLYRKYQ